MRLAARNPWWVHPGARPREGHLARRAACSRLLQHVREQERRAIVLEGPRQVGKTTLLLQVVSDLLESGYPPAAIVYCDFGDPSLHSPSIGDLEKAVPSTSVPRIYLLDEIAQSPDWDRWLKSVVDTRGAKWLATDSSATVLQKGTQESGMARWDLLRIEGLSFREFLTLQPGGHEASLQRTLERLPNALERYLALGGFPEHASSDDFTLVTRRIRDDVVERALAVDLLQRVSDMKRLRGLFAYLVEESGAILNAAKRARDIEVDRRTVQDWIALLVSAALLVELPREASSAAARLRAKDKPKIYAADHGVVGALAPGVSDADLKPRLVECVVFTHLRALARDQSGELSYVRPRDDLELDFVLKTRTSRIGLEVTTSPTLTPEKLARAQQAARTIGVHSLCVVHGGLTRQSIGDARLLPLRDFLLEPEAILEGQTVV